eukprot:GHRR01014432.1.p2 GENE.GHRR01014432.1~~GHRR01014432.1.p2  ORF type:complete len:479 (+),score=162.95 GHRR01014432.1:2279-3715(+)
MPLLQVCISLLFTACTVKAIPYGWPLQRLVSAEADDAFRAGFAVALVEGQRLQQCLLFGAAAGALTVTRKGAVSSLPNRQEVEQLLRSSDTPAAYSVGAAAGEQHSHKRATISMSEEVAGSGSSLDTCSSTCSSAPAGSDSSSSSQGSSSSCPYKFAYRLNSMGAAASQQRCGGDTVPCWIAQQGKTKGLDMVDLNYPQHFAGLQTDQVRKALIAAGLQAGAINMRYPADFHLGALTNADEGMRDKAVQLAVGGCNTAAELGASQLIIWSPYDGYNYHFEVDYATTWQHMVSGLQQIVAGCPPNIKVSWEFKPTDAASRFAVVPSTGAALLLAQEVSRPQFGLTLDIGHLLMAGENPAHSIAMVGRAGKLFGLHLNDAHVKLGAEDGLAFGAVNPVMAVEVVRWLQRTRYDGHIYFDTFTFIEQPVREAEYNIRRFKALWFTALDLAAAGIDELASRRNSMAVLELLERHLHRTTFYI